MKKYEINDKYSYCLGMSLTIEALIHKPDKVREVILSSKANKNVQFSYLLDLCDENHISYYTDDQIIDKLSVKENCYCIGVFDKFYSDIRTNRHLVLYGFNDFGELGTILRSAVSFDFEDIVLIHSQIDYFDPRCIRASMGSVFHCNIVSFEDFDSYIEKYKGHHLYPFVSKAEKKLDEIRFIKPYSLIISQDEKMLDEIFEEGIMIEHDTDKKISLSIRSSIILAEAYHQNLSL